jgi:hypothetical protein
LFLTVRNQTVSSTFKRSFIGGAIVALVLGFWLAQLWSAENQVRLHSEHFLRQIAMRKVAGAGAFLLPQMITGTKSHAGATFVIFRPKTLWMRSLVGSASMLLTFFAMARLPVTASSSSSPRPAQDADLHDRQSVSAQGAGEG